MLSVGYGCLPSFFGQVKIHDHENITPIDVAIDLFLFVSLVLMCVTAGHPFFYYMSLIIDIGFNMADLLMMWTAAATGAKTGSAFWTLPEHFHLL